MSEQIGVNTDGILDYVLGNRGFPIRPRIRHPHACEDSSLGRRDHTGLATADTTARSATDCRTASSAFEASQHEFSHSGDVLDFTGGCFDTAEHDVQRTMKQLVCMTLKCTPMSGHRNDPQDALTSRSQPTSSQRFVPSKIRADAHEQTDQKPVDSIPNAVTHPFLSTLLFRDQAEISCPQAESTPADAGGHRGYFMESEIALSSSSSSSSFDSIRSSTIEDRLSTGLSTSQTGASVFQRHEDVELSYRRSQEPCEPQTAPIRLDAGNECSDDVKDESASLPSDLTSPLSSEDLISTEISTRDVIHPDHADVEISYRRFQEACERYLNFHELESGPSEKEGSECDADDFDRDSSPPAHSTAVNHDGSHSGSSSNRNISFAPEASSTNSNGKRSGQDSEDGDSSGKRRKRGEFPQDQCDSLIVCPDVTCQGRDVSISEWLIQLQHHGWFVCCICLCSGFNDQTELNIHKSSPSCVPHCVKGNCAGNSRDSGSDRHLFVKGKGRCPERGLVVRRSKYEYVCKEILMRDAKPFAYGKRQAHKGVGTRDRSSASERHSEVVNAFRRMMEDVQTMNANRLREAHNQAERNMASANAQHDRDLANRDSIIRHLAEQLLHFSPINRSTLLDIIQLPRQTFTQEDLNLWSGMPQAVQYPQAPSAHVDQATSRSPLPEVVRTPQQNFEQGNADELNGVVQPAGEVEAFEDPFDAFVHQNL